MRSLHNLIKYIHAFRSISSTSANSSISRQSRFMKKLMHGTNKSRKVWYDTSVDLRKNINITPVNKSLSAHTTRRMTIRDKIFLQHITDLISMGTVPDIISHNIEITHVKITADFKYVNIFWTYGNNDDLFIDEEILGKCAKIIRHELSQLRVIGVVPIIQFVKNKYVSLEKEVEKKIRITALDKAFESVPNSEKVNDSCTSTTHETSDENLVSNNNSAIDEFRFELPVMKHNVLGLDHYKIMSHITASLSKSKVATQKRKIDVNVNIDNKASKSDSQEVADFLTRKEQQKVFADFLTKRRIEEKRQYRLKHSQKYEQKLLNNYDEDTNSNYEEYDDNFDEFEHTDEFEDQV